MFPLDLKISDSCLPLCSNEPEVYNIEPGCRGLCDEEQSVQTIPGTDVLDVPIFVPISEKRHLGLGSGCEMYENGQA